MNSIAWRSPSNIALIKYWGKKDIQIPMNPSISFTLKNSYTETKVSYSNNSSSQKIIINLLFEGKPNTAFEVRLLKFVNSILEYIPILKGLKLDIESKNSFPHSAGIASSASAMSALALCLVSIEHEITGKLSYISDFYKKASFIARLGSGSASRSIYGGINLWGELPNNKLSSNLFAIDISNKCNSIFKTYADAILIVTNMVKKVSSTAGHSLMKNHPFADKKFEHSFKNASELVEVLKNGDKNKFAILVEAEAMFLHAMMMTSNPPYLLLEPNTLQIINRIQEFRNERKIQVCFTLDAGANVHLLYPEQNRKEVLSFINDLLPFCHKNQWIDDMVGSGSEKIENILL